MTIYQRRILTGKTYEEVCGIIRESAYFETCRIEGDAFSMKYPRRNQRGQIMLTPVKGEIACGEDGTSVTLKLQAGWEMLLGIAISSLGFLGMLLKLVFPALGWWVGSVLTTGFGALITVFSWLRGIEIIDLLEHKLTR